MARTRHKKWLVCLLSVMIVLAMMPATAFAQTNVCQIVGGESYPTMEAALENTVAGDTVQLADDFAFTQDVTVAKDITLDLNGKTLTTGSFSIKLNGGDLTIKDSSDGGNGKITGTDYIVDTTSDGSDKVTLESGTLEGTKSTSVIRINRGSNSFEMKGGVAKQAKSNAQNVIAVNGGGVASIIGGRIEGSIQGISATTSTSSIVVGNIPAVPGSQTEEEAAAVYVSAVRSASANASITLNSGTVGKLLGTFDSEDVFNAWFAQDVSGVLPVGLLSTEVDGHWVVEQLTEEKAVARIGDTLYGSLVAAADALEDGQTLVLLKNYEGTQQIEVTVQQGTIDLNGYSITNTDSGENGLSLRSNTSSSSDVSIVVKNTGSAVSTISAGVPVYAKSGNSLNPLCVSIEDNIELNPTNAGDSSVVLDNAAYMEYNDRVAGYITTGGFLSNNANGKQYVYGTFAKAAENDVNNTAVLLNDYNGTIAVNNDAEYILDLDGHTVRTEGDTAIQANCDGVSLTIKNGTVISADGTGAEVGIPMSGDSYHNINFTLENVNLTAGGSDDTDYAIVTNGNDTGININIIGGSVTATNSIAIYFPPADSSLTIDGAAVTGTTGVAVKGGEITIKGDAQIKGTGEKHEPVASGSGVTDTGDALYVEGNYSRDLTVEILGGTFTSEKGQSVQMLEEAGVAGSKDVTIYGGTFDSDVTGFVYTGLQPDANGDGTFTVTKLTDVYVSGTGSDDNSGTNTGNAIKSLDLAQKLVAEDGKIYICGTVTVDSDLTLAGVTIERVEGFTGTMITVSGTDAKLTLSGVTIDGKNNAASDYKYLLNVVNGVLNIEEGSKLTNNNATAVYVGASGTLNMNGGEISGNNASSASAMGGALLNYGTANLNGGEIKNNSAPWGGGIMALGGSTTVIDGASVSGNTATAYGGGGLYLYGDGGALTFEMKSGAISGNTAINGSGAGIYAFQRTSDVTLRISGGIIKDNASDPESSGSAILLYSEDADGVPRLELSGSPEISGEVFFMDDFTIDYTIYVTDEFDPVNQIMIYKSDNKVGIPAVNYAEGLTPSLDDFAPMGFTFGFKVEGQNLVWAEAGIVYFYDEDGTTEYKDYRHGVIFGETIDPADVPAPVKSGYTLAGWQVKGTDDLWDLASDTVSGNTRLVAVWTLNAPSVSVSADTLTLHADASATLTALTTHEVAGVTYTYQWYKDGAAIDGATAATLTAAEEGRYTVKVTASDGSKTSAAAESAPTVITKEGHVYVPTVTPPTCTEQGYTTYTCSVCGDSYVDDYTPANGHTFKTVIDKPATATEAGLQHEECEICGYEKAAVEIPATGETDKPSGETPDAGKPDADKPSGESPEKTGDVNDIMPWLALLAMTGAALAGTARLQRRREK